MKNTMRLFKKYVVMCLGILGIFLILLLPIYRAIYKGTEDLLLKNMDSRLEQGMLELDARIGRMRTISNFLWNNEDVKKLAESKEGFAVKQYSNIMGAKGYLQNCIMLGLEDSDGYVMFCDNDIIITTSAILSNALYHAYSDYTPQDMDFDEFRQLIFQKREGIQYIPLKSDADDSFFCIIKGISNKYPRANIAVVFKVDANMLRQTLGVDPGSPMDFIYITDVNGKIVYQFNYTEDPLSDEILQKGKMKLNGQKYVLLSKQLEDSGLTIIAGISSKTVRQSVNNVNRIIWLYILVFVLSIIFFYLSMVIRNLKSRREILRSLKYDENDEVRIDIKYITDGINSLYNKNEEYREKITKISESISNSMLEKLLLKDNYSMQEMEEINSFLQWTMEFYCVVCVDTQLQAEEKVLDLFYRSDVFMSTHFMCKAVNMEKNERVYIICMDGSDAPDTKAIAALLRELLTELENVRIGISSVGTGLENIRLCYRYAKMAVQRISYTHDTGIEIYQEWAETRKKLFKLDLGNRIYDLIYAEETEALKAVFADIKSYMRKYQWSSEQEVMRFFFEVQNPIARVWDELLENKVTEHSFPAYDSQKSIIKLIDELEETSYYLCTCIRKSKEDYKTAFLNKMLTFVEENYRKPEMCVSYAAEYMGISDKYFIKLFKEQAGKNFGAYVERKRLEQAEKYLLETEWSMSRIAEEVGYNTIDAFYKSFKKNYGIAPGKWKESKKQEP